jgi:hypothetical protein
MKISHELKDKAVLSCWIAGLLILISIFWVISQNVQTFNLLRTVNNVLISNNDSRRVHAFIPGKTAKKGLLGYWYSMNNPANQMFVFTVFQGGILVPLGAVVSSGSVEEIIPLSSHAVQIFDNIPQGILQMYIDKIETTASAGLKGNVK